MAKAVEHFNSVLADNIMGQMAVIAFCDMMMCGLLPGVHILLHDMTIHASVGIVRKIGVAFGVNKGIAAQAQDHAKENQYNDA